jgi:acetyltransferase-like isoleucine patch superfamily enzyme
MTSFDELRAAHRAAAEELRERWDRDLPFDELVSDRWERAERLGFGEGASIYGSAYVYGEVRVGARTWVGPFVILDGSGGLTIGENCSISAGVQVYTHDTVQWALTNGAAESVRAPTSIGNCCFIGPRATIVHGVTIGDNSVVGAHSFVDRDVPARAIAVGTPARIVGHVELNGARAELIFDES